MYNVLLSNHSGIFYQGHDEIITTVYQERRGLAVVRNHKLCQYKVILVVFLYIIFQTPVFLSTLLIFQCYTFFRSIAVFLCVNFISTIHFCSLSDANSIVKKFSLCKKPRKSMQGFTVSDLHMLL